MELFISIVITCLALEKPNGDPPRPPPPPFVYVFTVFISTLSGYVFTLTV